MLFSSEISKNLSEEKRDLLNRLLELCNNPDKAWITPDFKKLAHNSQYKFLAKIRSIIESIVSFLAPNNAEEVLDSLCSGNESENPVVLDGKFLSVMKGVTQAYQNADDWPTRRAVLSIVAPKIGYKLIQSFLPDLTMYRFSSARLHAAVHRTGTIVQPPPRLVNRFDDAQVEHFVDFLTSDHVSTDLPFGEKCMKLTDGTELFVPDTIRNIIPTRIIEQYYGYCNEVNPGFPPLGMSSLYKIIDVCKASTRKSLQGIDYYAADAGEAFDSLQKMIENLNLLSAEAQRLIDNLRQGRQYLKSDFKLHVSESSDIADHCICHALSDPSDKAFRSKCNHDHSNTCKDCLLLANTFIEIEALLVEKVTDEDEAKRAVAKLKLLKEPVDAYKSHQMRTVNQDRAREEVLAQLPKDSFYYYMDWAMKFLPAKYREAQSDFFGKRGLSWHVSVVMMNDSTYDPSVPGSNKFLYKIFVHSFDNCTQDSTAVTAIMTDVLQRMKEKDPSLKTCYIRSDNAGCYKAAETVLAVPKVFELTEIQVRRIDFSEAQSGKGPCDRYAAVIKANVRRYLNEKNSVTTAKQFVEAANSHHGVSGVEIFESRLKLNANKQKARLPKIHSLNNFEFEREGVRVHRAYKVGEGNFYSWKQLDPLKVLSEVLCEDITFSEKSSEYHSIKKKSHQESDDLSSLPSTSATAIPKAGVSDAIFECTEPGCVDKFVKYGNLVRHVCNGTHTILPEQHCLSDTAAIMYKTRSEQIENRQICSLLLEKSRTREIFETKKIAALPEGWALPVPRKNVRFTEQQVVYLTERFEEGLKKDNQVRWKPEAVAEHMRELKINGKFHFSTEEFLKPSQIRSFFSRLSSKRKNLPVVDEEDEQECYKEQRQAESEELISRVKNVLVREQETPMDSPRSLKREASTSNPQLNTSKRFSLRSSKK
ncbi:unnamed protein product [Didymodactylos carnosus]|uniref:C2H2-type domain-containing protein n=1 Tax=Didymodactylos carnosus TaxID=1234261 RepID=A0A814VWM1_9BILA|nr:unnamed protein product [Didymodactylos carnosus]CAF3958270.1 unnamed protein product [Didymodactylos carnosus]